MTGNYFVWVKLGGVHQQMVIRHASGSADRALCWGRKEWFGLYSPVTATRHMGHPVQMEGIVLSKKAKFMDLHAVFLQLMSLII